MPMIMDAASETMVRRDISVSFTGWLGLSPIITSRTETTSRCLDRFHLAPLTGRPRAAEMSEENLAGTAKCGRIVIAGRVAATSAQPARATARLPTQEWAGAVPFG